MSDDTTRPLPIAMLGGPYPDMQPSLHEFHMGDGVTVLRTDRVVMRKWTKEDDGWHFRVTHMFPLDVWDSMLAAIRPKVAFCTQCPFAMHLHPTPPEAGDCPGYL